MKKVGKVIMHNFGLKVLAVIFAIIAWLAIVNTADLEKTVTFTVPVEIVNAEYLTDNGKTFEIQGNTDTVSFTVTGVRSIVERLTADDFIATANMENIDDTMTMVPIVLTATRYSSQLDIIRPSSYLMVEVEDLATREVEVRAVVGGSPQTDCFVADTEVSPSHVTVTGPKSIVDEIDFAEVLINVNGADDTMSAEGSIQLLNKDGGEADTEKLTMDAVSAEVTARILMRKTVPITLDVTGDPADGYWYSGAECDVESLTIEGEPGTIEDIEQIIISSSKLTVRRADQDVHIDLPLSDLLPGGVGLAEDEPESLDITLHIDPAVTVEAEISARNISVTGLGEGLSVELLTDPVIVEITGPEEVIDSLNTNRLSGEVDVSGLKKGNHTLDIAIETDGSYRAEAAVTVSITETDSSGGLNLEFLQ